MLPMPLIGFSVAFKHGKAQAWAIQALKKAIAEALLSEKEAAGLQDLTGPQWSRQCGNNEGSHVSYQRLFALPTAVLKALGKSLYEEFSDGGRCIARSELLRAVEVMTRVADAVESKKPLRMELAELGSERVSA